MCCVDRIKTFSVKPASIQSRRRTSEGQIDVLDCRNWGLTLAVAVAVRYTFQ